MTRVLSLFLFAAVLLVLATSDAGAVGRRGKAKLFPRGGCCGAAPTGHPFAPAAVSPCACTDCKCPSCAGNCPATPAAHPAGPYEWEWSPAGPVPSRPVIRTGVTYYGQPVILGGTTCAGGVCRPAR